MGEREHEIISFIIDELLEEDEEITAESSLFQDRVLDSLSLIQLISFLEKSYNVKIGTSEVTLENLDSVEKMLRFLASKGIKE